MGYYTNYSISTNSAEHDEEIIQEIVELSGYDDTFENECKWYDHEENVQEISAKWPDVLITLEGEGEESGDLWIKYFKGGKMQKCPAKVSYDEYDENKLV